ncbi:MAG: AbrB/MazE/SpoVT family DNA-binding domain-containing protein [Candidatus Aenigmarchaeota archaeon]|nr:AbrB/MazE/SpoVT family DNA-binding domain-containing protein [Candidatus Aenigmarchaeota archaeon]
MATLRLDDRGRLLLSKETRKKYGDEFAVVQAPGEIVLIPVPRDPLRALKQEGRRLPKGLSIAEIKRKARDHAMKEILEEAGKRK